MCSRQSVGVIISVVRDLVVPRKRNGDYPRFFLGYIFSVGPMQNTKGHLQIESVQVIKHLVLNLVLENGRTVQLDCASLVHSGLSLGLLDTAVFAGVQVSSDGGLIWPNGHQVSAELVAGIIG